MAITNRQQQALQALLTYPTKKEAAAAAGIGERTIRAYLGNAEFLAEYKKACRALVADASRQAQTVLSPALSVLQEIAENKTESSSTRVAAARSILEYGLRLTEFSDVESALEELECITMR